MTVLTKVAAATPARPPSRPSRLLALGLLAGPLFTAGYLVLGAVHGDGYSAVRHPVGSHALGPHGWAQVANFVVGGLLVVLFAVGLRRSLRPGRGAAALPALVMTCGIGLIGAGVLRSDPVGATVLTWHGQLHNLAFALPGSAALTLAMVAAAITFARRGFAVYSMVSALAFTTLFAVAMLGFLGVDPWATTAGLWQRLGLSTGFLWLALLAITRRRVTQTG